MTAGATHRHPSRGEWCEEMGGPLFIWVRPLEDGCRLRFDDLESFDRLGDRLRSQGFEFGQRQQFQKTPFHTVHVRPLSPRSLEDLRRCLEDLPGVSLFLDPA